MTKSTGAVMTIVLLAASAGCGPAGADEALTVFGEKVGCGKFVTRAPAEGEIVIDQAPFLITKPGKYIVTKDLQADASCIGIQTGGVTLDLNGHTLRYGMGERPTTGRGVVTYNSWRKGNIGHAGILCPGRPDRTQDFKGFRWNSHYKNVVIRNGKVRDGTGKGLAYSNGVDLGGADGAVVEDVVIEVAAADTFALLLGAGGKARRVTIFHNGTHVTNRHQQVGDIAAGPNCRIHHCWLEGGPQAGVKAGSGTEVHHNLIRHRATVTNCYGVQGYGQKDVRIHHNRIISYNGRGIHLSEKGANWDVHHNYVEVRETRNREYRRMQTHGIKLEGTRNSKVHDNVVLSVSSDGGEPTPLNFSVKAGSGNVVRDNTFIALTVNRQGAYAAYFVGADLAGTEVRDNTFYTNNVCYYVGPDGGRNTTFRRCTFRKIDPDDDVLFYMNRNYKKTYTNRDRLIDCVFADGIDPKSYYFPGRGAGWRSPGDYTVGWSLALTVTDGGKPVAGAAVTATDKAGAKVAAAETDAAGKVGLDLAEFRVVFDRDAVKTSVLQLAPYAVRIAAGGKSRTLKLAPVAPMAARVDLGGAGDLILTPPRPRAGEVGDAYRLRLSATCAAPQWRITKGALPPGLKLEAGAVTGTPTKAGEFNFTLRAAGGVTKRITLKIAPKPATPFWRKRVELAGKKRIAGRVGVHFDAAKDK